VHDGRVPDDVYRAAAEVFKEDELAAVIWAAIVINAYNRVAISTRMAPGNYRPAAR
jgi:alkylhydroperoxidase family enzyme